MKISQTVSGTQVDRSRRAGKTGSADADGAFRQHIDDGAAPETQAPSGTTPLAALGSLLAVQEAPDPTTGTRRAILHGDTLLDELKELQLGLVQGWVSEGSLRTLAHMLDRPRPAIDDPELSKVIDDIEVRAAVELAKLERKPS